MAGNYPIPHWIPGPQDVASQFLSGLRAGAQIQQEEARLAQEANLRQMEAMLKQQENERQNALERERLAQTQAYNQAQIDARRQELAETKRVNEIKVQESARLFRATQQFQDWLAVNPDKDPAEGILKFFPGTGESATGYGTLARSMFEARQKLGPPTIEEVEGHKFLRIPERGGAYRMQELREGTMDARRVNMRIQYLQRQAAALEKEIESQAPLYEGKGPSKMSEGQKRMYEAYEAKKDRLSKINETIDEMYASGELSLGEGTAGAAPGGAAYADFFGRTNAPGGFRIKSVDGKPWTGPGAAPPTPSTPAAPLNIPTPPGFGFGLTQPPALPQGLPEAPGQPFLPTPANVPLGPPMPRAMLPSGPPGKLFEGSGTPLSFREGEIVRMSQKQLSDTMGRSNPNDLVAAAKRLGVTGASYDDQNQRFYGITGEGAMDRNTFENRILRLSTEKNQNPFQ